MNRVVVSGRLAADPELKKTPNDISVTSFSIAVKRPFSKDTVDWIDCVAWRRNAEFITKYFGKGKMILLQGILQTRFYEDREGHKRKVVEVLVDQAEFCGSDKQARADNTIENIEPDNSDFTIIAQDDDLPF